MFSLVLCLVFWLPFVSLQSMNGVAITCSSIGNTSYSIVGSLLACSNYDGAISTFPDSSVMGAYHENGTVMLNEVRFQIRSVHFDSIPSLKFIPARLRDYFYYMRALVIIHSGLLSVNKENMLQFGTNLDYLNLYGNWLNYLDVDVFTSNLYLKYLDLRDNPFRHIDSSFFSNIRGFKYIKVINLSPAGCIYQYFNSEIGHNLTTFKWNNEACFDKLVKIEKEMAPIRGRIQNSLQNEMSLNTKIEQSTGLITEKLATSAIQSNYTEKFSSLTNSVNKLFNENISLSLDKLNLRAKSLESNIEITKNRMESIEMKLDGFLRIYTAKTVQNNDQM